MSNIAELEFTWQRGEVKEDNERWNEEINRTFRTLCLHASNELVKKYGKEFSNVWINLYATDSALTMLSGASRFEQKPADDRFVESFVGTLGRFHIYYADEESESWTKPNMGNAAEYAYLVFKPREADGQVHTHTAIVRILES